MINYTIRPLQWVGERTPADDRFWSQVEIGSVPVARPDLGVCWLYTGQQTDNGYGRFWADGHHTVAHVWLWERENGPVPAGLQLDHLCRVRPCVRPTHLEPVTALENVRRSNGNGRRTHCPRGHLYDDGNTRVYRGRRYCRACNSNGGRGRALGVAS